MYHALNRAVARLPLFQKDRDDQAFERVLDEALREQTIRLLGYCLMPNHWHMVLWPEKDDESTGFLRWLTHTHSMRWHAHYHTGGSGHLYQGRFKSFPVQSDEHLLAAMRYVEHNPVRAGLVVAAEQWRWSSAWARRQRDDSRRRWLTELSDPPLPRQWRSFVNQPQSEAEVTALRRCIQRGSPFGEAKWARQSAVRLGLQSTLRPRGRPKKEPEKKT